MDAIKHFLRLIMVPMVLAGAAYAGFWVTHDRLPHGFDEIIRWLS